MKHAYPLVIAFVLALGCSSSDSTTTPPTDSGGVDTNYDSGPNACVVAGGKCAKEAESFSCAAFGPYWEEVAPGDKLHGTCGGTPVPEGSGIPSRLYPCCMGVFGDGGSDADAADSTDSSDSADASG